MHDRSSLDKSMQFPYIEATSREKAVIDTKVFWLYCAKMQVGNFGLSMTQCTVAFVSCMGSMHMNFIIPCPSYLPDWL